jgi:hypothetical protein
VPQLIGDKVNYTVHEDFMQMIEVSIEIFTCRYFDHFLGCVMIMFDMHYVCLIVTSYYDVVVYTQI